MWYALQFLKSGNALERYRLPKEVWSHQFCAVPNWVAYQSVPPCVHFQKKDKKDAAELRKMNLVENQNSQDDCLPQMPHRRQSQTSCHPHQNLLSLLLNPRQIGDWTILEYNNLMDNQCFSNPKEQQCQSRTESYGDAGTRKNNIYIRAR